MPVQGDNKPKKRPTCLTQTLQYQCGSTIPQNMAFVDLKRLPSVLILEFISLASAFILRNIPTLH
jgi:hypothetical protein